MQSLLTTAGINCFSSFDFSWGWIQDLVNRGAAATNSAAGVTATGSQTPSPSSLIGAGQTLQYELPETF